MVPQISDSVLLSSCSEIRSLSTQPLGALTEFMKSIFGDQIYSRYQVSIIRRGLNATRLQEDVPISAYFLLGWVVPLAYSAFRPCPVKNIVIRCIYVGRSWSPLLQPDTVTLCSALGLPCGPNPSPLTPLYFLAQAAIPIVSTHSGRCSGPPANAGIERFGILRGH